MSANGLTEKYLLNALSQEERVSFEEKYFSDDAAFEEAWSKQDDLIDAYVLGQLSEPDRHMLERRLLNIPQARSRVDFARAFMEYVNPEIDDVTANNSTDQTGSIQNILSFLGLYVGTVMGCVLISEAVITNRSAAAKFCFFVSAFVLLSEVIFLAVQHAWRAMSPSPGKRKAAIWRDK